VPGEDPFDTAGKIRDLPNADVERGLDEAMIAGDMAAFDVYANEVEERERWARDAGAEYSAYDDLLRNEHNYEPTDLPAFEDIPQEHLTPQQVKDAWHDEQWMRAREAEDYGGGIRRDLLKEATERGIDLDTLFTHSDPRIAYKYANEELLKWWEEHGGRRPLWEAQAVNGNIDKAEGTRRRLVEGKARQRAQQMIGKNYQEEQARIRQEQQRARRAKAKRWEFAGELVPA